VAIIFDGRDLKRIGIQAYDFDGRNPPSSPASGMEFEWNPRIWEASVKRSRGDADGFPPGSGPFRIS
jgi:hypothetical protein